MSAATVSARFLLISSDHRIHSVLVCSLGYNELKAEGAKHVADMLAVNKTLTSVEYATARHAGQQALSVLVFCSFL